MGFSYLRIGGPQFSSIFLDGIFHENHPAMEQPHDELETYLVVHPTNRVGGLVLTPVMFVDDLPPQKSHENHQGCGPHKNDSWDSSPPSMNTVDAMVAVLIPFCHDIEIFWAQEWLGYGHAHERMKHPHDWDERSSGDSNFCDVMTWVEQTGEPVRSFLNARFTNSRNRK